MAKDTELQTLDGETLAQLEQVRKGKPRKFVLICKGATILSLVVYKKGSLDKYKKQAKESGTGQLYYGTVDGRGPELRFALSRAEGFDKEPVKPTVLKSFLEDSGDFKCKPRFEVVDFLRPVLDEDDPLVQRFLKLQEAALAACDTHPKQAEAINRFCYEIGSHFDAEERDDAATKLDVLESLLQGLGAPESRSSEQPISSSELDGLLQRIRAEVDPLGSDGAKYLETLAAVDKLKQASKFDDALKVAKALFAKLAGDCRERLREVGVRVQTLLSGSFTERGGDVEKIKTVFGFAKERADEERFGSALVALRNVAKLLDVAESGDAPKESDVIQSGTVAARKKFVESRWQEVMREVRAQLQKLRTAITQYESGEAADELATGIEGAVEDFCDDLNRAIFAVAKSGEEDSKPVEQALKTIADYRKRVATDALIRHLSDSRSEMGTDVDLATTITTALDDLESRLNSAR